MKLRNGVFKNIKKCVRQNVKEVSEVDFRLKRIEGNNMGGAKVRERRRIEVLKR